MPQRVPESWTAIKTTNIPAGMVTTDGRINALTELAHNIIDHRGIQYEFGGGVGGYSEDVSEIVAGKLISVIDERKKIEDTLVCNEDGCYPTITITNISSQDISSDRPSAVITCEKQGFRTQIAANQQEEKCRICHIAIGSALLETALTLNTVADSTKKEIIEVEQAHAQKLAELRQKLNETL